MEDRRKISSTRELINILDSAEINAKEIQAVKDEIGYEDSNFPDAEGNTTTLTQYIHNYSQSLKDELTKLRTEAKEMTIDYVKSQCTKTHVLLSRQELEDMARYCRDAYDTVDSVEYDADECSNYANGISNSLSDTKDSMSGLQEDLGMLAKQDMPEEEEELNE